VQKQKKNLNVKSQNSKLQLKTQSLIRPRADKIMGEIFGMLETFEV
jgi:hypothetical protein